jgi:hypothetical protein
VASDKPKTFLNKIKIVTDMIRPAEKAEDNLAPSRHEIKLEAKKVEKTKPITGKKIAYIIKIKAVIKISIILLNLGHAGFMSGLKTRNKEEVIKKKDTI